MVCCVGFILWAIDSSLKQTGQDCTSGGSSIGAVRPLTDCLANIEFYSTSSISCTEEEIEWQNLSWNYDSALSYEWTFNGGTPSNSSEENPIITYSEPGSYDVALTISNGESEITKVFPQLFIFNSTDFETSIINSLGSKEYFSEKSIIIFMLLIFKTYEK